MYSFFLKYGRHAAILLLVLIYRETYLNKIIDKFLMNLNASFFEKKICLHVYIDI